MALLAEGPGPGQGGQGQCSEPQTTHTEEAGSSGLGEDTRAPNSGSHSRDLPRPRCVGSPPSCCPSVAFMVKL